MSSLIYLIIGVILFLLGVGVAFVLTHHAKAQLSEHFKSLSFDVLQSNSRTLVDLAKGELEKAQLAVKGDLAQRQEAIKTLVEPLREQLEIYQKR